MSTSVGVDDKTHGATVPATGAGWTGRLSGGSALVAGIAGFKLAIHLATAGFYGFFIDELYFLACGQHLAWGYVDMPPLTAFQAWMTRALFGDSPYSIRLFPSLAGAGLVLLAGAMVRRLGGGRFAQVLAALAVAFAPHYFAFDSYLSMNSIEPLLWTGCAFVLIRTIQTGNPRFWLLFGAIAGVGLLNKHTMMMFGFALVLGLLLTAERRLMANRYFLLGGAIAFLIVVPNLIWMIEHHFPHLELLANIKRNQRDVQFSFLGFFGMQVLFLNPVAAPLWLVGLWRLLFSRSFKPYRALGWAYLVAFAVLLLTHGKIYYLGPAYAMLFAAGAVAFEHWGEQLRWRFLPSAYAVSVAGTGLLMAPFFMPLLQPEAYMRYNAMLGIPQPRLENRRTGPMPQHFADRFGWPEMVEAVAQVYFSLPPEEREKCAIFANDFGESGAVDFYGPKRGLPKSIGNHLTNWYWGPREYSGEVMIVLGDRPANLERHFDSVQEVATVGHPYAMRQEHFSICLCRKPKGWKLKDVWPTLKNWN